MNINLEQQSLEMCLKTINNLGSTTYQNICTGEATIVPWGFFDWILSIVVILFFVVIIWGVGRAIFDSY